MAQNLTAITSMLPKILASQQMSSPIASAIYTVPESTSAIVKGLVLSNVTGQATALSAALSTVGLAAPVQTAPSTSTAGGTGLAAATTYFYKVTALNAAGETVGSNELSILTGAGATNSNTVNWGAIAGATSHRVYRGTAAGVENVFYTVGAVGTFVDTGAANTAGTVPIANTTAAITALPITAIGYPIASGTQVVVVSGVNTQSWTLTAPAAAGAVSFAVTSQVPNFAYPSGSAVTATASTVTVTVSLVPSGGAFDGTHVVVNQYPLAGRDTLALSPTDLAGGELGPGDAIWVQASLASAVDATVTGIENS